MKHYGDRNATRSHAKPTATTNIVPMTTLASVDLTVGGGLGIPVSSPVFHENQSIRRFRQLTIENPVLPSPALLRAGPLFVRK